MTSGGAASCICALLWSSLGFLLFLSASVTAVPFLPNTQRMSLAFFKRSSQLLLHSDPSLNFMLQLASSVRGGYYDEATLQQEEVIPTRIIVTNESLSIAHLDDKNNNETVLFANNTNNNSETRQEYYNFSLFQPGDGSETDPDGIPGRFLRMQKGNRFKAKHALDTTLTWRESNHVNTILSRPHVQYEVCKRVLPHYFAGRDVSGHVIFVQRPGKISLTLAQHNNCTEQDLLHHYVYILEYCWNILESRPDQTMTSIIDLGGLNFRQVRDMFHFVKEFVNVMSLHYPQRSYKTLLINAPKWFHTIYRLISPILRESTRTKISIYSGGKTQRDALLFHLGNLTPHELIHDDDTSSNVDTHEDDAATATGPSSPMEQELRAFCLARLEEEGLVMQPVLEVEMP